MPRVSKSSIAGRDVLYIASGYYLSAWFLGAIKIVLYYKVAVSRWEAKGQFDTRYMSEFSQINTVLAHISDGR